MKNLPEKGPDRVYDSFFTSKPVIIRLPLHFDSKTRQAPTKTRSI